MKFFVVLEIKKSTLKGLTYAKLVFDKFDFLDLVKTDFLSSV